ncbi:MAG: glycosyl hydrolase 115 family protein [Microbacter sp.]
MNKRIFLQINMKSDHPFQVKNLWKWKVTPNHLFSFVVLFILMIHPWHCRAIGGEAYILHNFRKGDFVLINHQKTTPIVVDTADYWGVLRAANDLRNDFQRVTGQLPSMLKETSNQYKQLMLIGTIGKNRWIDRLVAKHLLNVDSVAGKWEAFTIQVVENPFPGIYQALVIAGSDQRGTIYGIYDLSEQIGVSPWYWWDDVKPLQQSVLAVKSHFVKTDRPMVKYRSIFINDEAPCLADWVKNFYGGVFNHYFYEHVFELILRLKGNYLWPAMWGKAFAIDDPENPMLANQCGIVMGTSHHEPMMRAQKEWELFGHGPWNFETNRNELIHFWEQGIERNKNNEDIITIGMRGDGDKPLNDESIDHNIALMQKIVATQEKIIARFLNPDVAKVPQLWALYKEVQDYYDHGMKVPDYVTLLWCDDNWGNIRRLPSFDERKRAGGAGIYYHVDYVGAPRCYKWLNTVPVTKIWEQMNKAYEYGADRVWVLNVGDIKLLEYPISFFMDLAWNPERWNRNNLFDYTRLWADQLFGNEHDWVIAHLLMKYSAFNGRIKPELISPKTFSLLHYNEADRVVYDWRMLARQADSLASVLPSWQHDAFYELVQYPIDACANLNELYVDVAKNRFYASQGRAIANLYADSVKMLFANDARLTTIYHHQIAGGRWNGVIGQPHFGYTSWRDPVNNIMPKVDSLVINPQLAEMGIAVEGDSLVSDGVHQSALPLFDGYSRSTHYFDLFNRGTIPFSFTISSDRDWILPSIQKGTVTLQQRVDVAVDWAKVPFGKHIQGQINVEGNGKRISILVSVFHPRFPARDSLQGFVESDGYLSMNAVHYSERHDVDGVGWRNVPWYGREFSSMMPFPVTAKSFLPSSETPFLEYRFYLFTKGTIDAHFLIAPTINSLPDAGLRFAVAFDDRPEQVISIPKISIDGQNDDVSWAKSVINNIRDCQVEFINETEGYHTIRVYMIDPIVVLQKIVLNTGGLRSSFLFPPESFHSSSVGGK